MSNSPRLSACITIHERDVPTLDTVFGSMRGQDYDEFVIVLDRTPAALAKWVREWWVDDARVRFVTLDGPPGWGSPVPPWNAGLRSITNPLVYCFSSETVQAAGNLERARARLATDPHVIIHGRAECSCGPAGTEVNWGGTAPGNLFSDSAHPRPLGFIWAGHMDTVRTIGYYDEEFARGFWHDDTDFFLRLWKSGADFLFDDAISGTHLHHERKSLWTTDGLAKIETNRRYILSKHGTDNPWGALPRIHQFGKSSLRWVHV